MRWGWYGAVMAAGAALVSGCGGDGDGPQDPCASGICPGDSGSGGGGASGASASGGSGGDNAGGSGAGSGGGAGGSGAGSGGSGGSSGSGGSGGSSGSGGSGAACTESWLCTPWQTDGNSDQGSRSCTDVNGCGSEVDKPVESAELAALDFNYYQCNVEPIFDRACAHLGCHGTEQGRALRIYARGRLRITGDSLSLANVCLSPANAPPKPSEECTGSVECACWVKPHTQNEWRANFDGARGFLLDGKGNALADPAASELLTQPLVGGGLAHAGIKFWAKGDPDYTKIESWLSGMTLGSCGLPQSQN